MATAGRPRRSEQLREQPAAGSSSLRSAVSTFACGSKTEIGGERAGAVLPVDGELRRERFRGDARRAGGGQLRLGSGDRRGASVTSAAARMMSMIDLDRRRRKPAVRSPTARAASGLPQHATSPRREHVDVERAREQRRRGSRRPRRRRARATGRRASETVIRLDRRVRGEDALDAGQRDLPLGRGEQLFEEAHEARTCRRRPAPAPRGDREHERGGENDEERRVANRLRIVRKIAPVRRKRRSRSRRRPG